MDKKFDLLEIKRIIRRRKKIFIISFLLIFMAAIIVALSLTPIYTSKATIRIEDQQIPENFVQSTITDYVEERIRRISETILSRSKLLEIIDKFNLYPELREEKSPMGLVNKMREDIEVETIDALMKKSGGRELRATVAFTLAYNGTDPDKVHKVATTLSELYFEQDTKEREERIAGTTDFLNIELQRLGTEIRRQEKIISEFKQNHLRELPDDRGYNLQAIARLERELDRADMDIQLLQENKVLLQAKLASVEPLTPIIIEGEDMAINPTQRLKRLRLELLSIQSTYSEKHPHIKKKKREIAKLEQQVKVSDNSVGMIKKLMQLEVKLESVKSSLGSKHPEVKALQREIAILRQQVDNLTEENSQAKIAKEKPDNPIYITLKIQIETTQMEIESHMKNRPKLISDIEAYRRRIDKAPIVEKELNALTRDYENLKQKYSEISNKLMNAELVQEMEGKDKGSRFNITSPAYLPSEPAKPNRLAIIFIGFVLGLGVAAGLVFFQESTDDTIKTSNQLKQLTSIPVLSTISYIETEVETRRRRIKYLLWACAGISFVGVALFFIDLFIMELDQAWEVVCQRILMIA